eukprot:750588-Hanusia_phi.AAC.1
MPTSLFFRVTTISLVLILQPKDVECFVEGGSVWEVRSSEAVLSCLMSCQLNFNGTSGIANAVRISGGICSVKDCWMMLIARADAMRCDFEQLAELEGRARDIKREIVE